MKPIVEYKAGKALFGATISVVQKRASKTEYQNFKDKQEFTDFVDSIRPSATVDGYVMILCSCGKEYDYTNKTEIPSSNLICGCGRKLIIYGT